AERGISYKEVVERIRIRRPTVILGVDESINADENGQVYSRGVFITTQSKSIIDIKSETRQFQESMGMVNAESKREPEHDIPTGIGR
ncbi:MAG: hypothetical protein QXI58_04280, partial [Candidatus Micrarchaeia archaeon]